MSEFMTKWNNPELHKGVTYAGGVIPQPSLFQAVFHCLRNEEIEGRTKLEDVKVVDESTFRGSGYGSGRQGYF